MQLLKSRDWTTCFFQSDQRAVSLIIITLQVKNINYLLNMILHLYLLSVYIYNYSRIIFEQKFDSFFVVYV